MPIMPNKPTHQKNESGEIDVFEATGYYAGLNDDELTYKNKIIGASLSHRIAKEVHGQGYLGCRGRDTASLDVIPMRQHQLVQPITQVIPKQKKVKQPISPGARLAHFLNTLFSQTVVPKKKKEKEKESSPFSSSSSSKSSAIDDSVDDVTSPASIQRSSRRRRNRSSSMDHFPIDATKQPAGSKPLYFSSMSGLRTPPPPCRKESLSSLSSCNGQSAKPSFDARINKEKVNLDCLSGKSKYKEVILKGYKESSVDEDGWDSESSSDLFELNLDKGSGFCSSDRPVYESTTCVDCLRKPGAAMIGSANVPIRIS